MMQQAAMGQFAGYPSHMYYMPAYTGQYPFAYQGFHQGAYPPMQAPPKQYGKSQQHAGYQPGMTYPQGSTAGTADGQAPFDYQPSEQFKHQPQMAYLQQFMPMYQQQMPQQPQQPQGQHPGQPQQQQAPGMDGGVGKAAAAQAGQQPGQQARPDMAASAVADAYGQVSSTGGFATGAAGASNYTGSFYAGMGGAMAYPQQTGPYHFNPNQMMQSQQPQSGAWSGQQS